MPQNRSETLTCCDFFSGIGLVRLGLERAGWNVLFSNDRSAEKFEMYASFFPDAAATYSIRDVFSLSPPEVPASLLATASFPCQDLSVAGRIDGLNGKKSSAFWGFIEILRGQAVTPKLVMLENVLGWLTSNRGRDFRIAIQALNRLGYRCDVFKIDASHFVPQSRPRIFAIGRRWQDRARTDEAIDGKTHSIFTRRSPCLRSKALDRAVLENLDLDWEFHEVPPLPRSTLKLDRVVEDLDRADDRWWAASEVERHLDMMTPINLSYLEKLRALPEPSYCSMYRRMRSGQQRAELRKDGLAGCLRTATGGSSRQMLVKVERDRIQMRRMTPREYARLQGVPDRYPMPPRVNQALTGFGDAVCVPAITWIAENILAVLQNVLPVEAICLFDVQRRHLDRLP